MNTEQLIERLAHDAGPVRPLQPPWFRTAVWLLGAGLYLGILTALITSSADLAANATRTFLVQQLAAIATGVAAAAAAFASVVPGSSRRVLFLPLVAAMLWLGTIMAGSLQEWVAGAPVGLVAPREWLCVVMITFGGAVPAVAITFMLRRGAPLTPRTTTALGVLAAAGLANVGACLSYPHPSDLTVLVWHGGTMLALVAGAAWAGRSVLA